MSLMTGTGLGLALLTAPTGLAQGPGDPTFVDLGEVPVGRYYPNDPILAELNGDGHLDLAIPVGEGYLPIYMGYGDGTFGPRIDLPVMNGRTPGLVTHADVNLDGKVDLVTANWPNYNGWPHPIYPDVSIFLGDGAGGFVSNPENNYQTGTPSSSNPYSAAVGDLDGDGFGDIVSAHWSGASVTVLHGVGDGTFTYNAAVDQYAIADSSCTDAALGHLNGDSALDVVVTGNFSSGVFVMLGNGDGSLQAPVKYPVLGRSGRADLADIDHDGDLDMVVNSWISTNVAVLLGNGNGTFQPMVQWDAGVSQQQAVFVDIDGDGELDIVTSNTGPPNPGLGGFSILLGNGNGTFQPYRHVPSGHQHVGLDTGDLNGDGALDVVLATSPGPMAYTVFLQVRADPTIQVQIDIKPGSFPNSINLGSKGVTPVAILSTASFDATQVDPLSVRLAEVRVRAKGNGTPQASFNDVDGDGLLDLVVHMETEGLQLTSDDVEATLDGSLLDTTPIRGTDSVRIVP